VNAVAVEVRTTEKIVRMVVFGDVAQFLPRRLSSGVEGVEDEGVAAVETQFEMRTAYSR
jgi:hypothetical protein